MKYLAALAIPVMVGCLMYVGYSVGSLQVENQQLTEQNKELLDQVKELSEDNEWMSVSERETDTWISNRCVCLAYPGSEVTDEKLTKSDICNYKKSLEYPYDLRRGVEE